MASRFWTAERIYEALMEFQRQYHTLCSTSYRTQRLEQPFAFPCHETIRQVCGPWHGVRVEVERRIEAAQAQEEAQL